MGYRRLPHKCNPSRHGFTFFEIAISLALATFCVLTVMALIPAGLKLQQKARYELLASAKACELIELFGGKPSEERIAEYETPEPWESRPYCYSGTRWDFEERTSRWDTGIMPVPADIANRLDSDNDEIHSILSQGGYLFYADPRSVPAVDTQFVNPMAANESLKLVFAVSGYAQDNAIPVFSYKAWPYRVAFPSPPQAIIYDGSQFVPADANSAYVYVNPLSNNPRDGTTFNCSEGYTNGVPDATLPGTFDPLMDILSQAAVNFELFTFNSLPGQNWGQPLDYNPPSGPWPNGYTGLYPYVSPPGVTPATTRTAQWAPFQGPLRTAVINYVSDKFNNGPISNAMGNLPITHYDAKTEYKKYYLAPGVPATDNSFALLGQLYDSDFYALCQMAEPAPGESYSAQIANGKAKLRAELALRVQCMRFWCMLASTYYCNNPSDPLNSGAKWDPTDTAVDLPMAYQPFAPDVLSLNRLRYYQDRAKTFSMRFAASFPYDWGTPRPIARCIMMDYPLFEYDMFSPPHSGQICGSGGVKAAQWCPISSQTITSIGMPPAFPGSLLNGVFDNTKSPFVPFDGLTRKPNGTNIWGDASHFTLTKPFQAAERCRQLVFWSVDWQSYEDAETAPSQPLDASRCPISGPSAGSINGIYQSRIQSVNLPNQDGLEYRNPERQLNFIQDMTTIATGQALVGPTVTVNGNKQPQWQYIELGGGWDGGGAPGNGIAVLDGIYGADRNHNFILDRGPIKKSQRMHAQFVARFNFYDPRIPITLR